MSIIQEGRYIDVSDMPVDPQECYRDFVQQCGLDSGEHWTWMVGEDPDDSTEGSWIGVEKVKVIDDFLRSEGLKDGDMIDLVFTW